MVGPYVSLLGLQSALLREWLRAVFTAADWYAIVLDPRPDLAVPARRVRHNYHWWW